MLGAWPDSPAREGNRTSARPGLLVPQVVQRRLVLGDERDLDDRVVECARLRQGRRGRCGFLANDAMRGAREAALRDGEQALHPGVGTLLGRPRRLPGPP